MELMRTCVWYNYESRPHSQNWWVIIGKICISWTVDNIRLFSSSSSFIPTHRCDNIRTNFHLLLINVHINSFVWLIKSHRLVCAQVTSTLPFFYRFDPIQFNIIFIVLIYVWKYNNQLFARLTECWPIGWFRKIWLSKHILSKFI